MKKQRKQLTEAQKQATEERKAIRRAICQKIKAMQDGERIRLASSVQARSIEGTAYSVHNQCMIAFQKKDATILGGFRQWQKHGRKVSKGAHGVGIWVPKFAGKETTEDGSKVEGDLNGFLFGTVFDVSQTEEMQAVV